MLSTSAFNALLKTLEEPPAHVKFIFATTEIRKVPVTVLSRCQRFDLRRIEPEAMLAHLASVAERERVTVAPDALALIVRAAEGSVRDALSLLDQAIAHGSGEATAAEVRAMLGLADRGRVLDLFEAVMAGDARAALDELAAQYGAGADPAAVLRDLAEVAHWVSMVKLAPEAADDPTVGPDERARGLDFAARLPIRVLARAWQMLLKALDEVATAPNAMMAAEMALIRLTHVADLPTPEDLVRRLTQTPPPAPPGGGGGGGARVRARRGGGAGGGRRAGARRGACRGRVRWRATPVSRTWWRWCGHGATSACWSRSSRGCGWRGTRRGASSSSRRRARRPTWRRGSGSGCSSGPACAGACRWSAPAALRPSPRCARPSATTCRRRPRRTRWCRRCSPPSPGPRSARCARPTRRRRGPGRRRPPPPPTTRMRTTGIRSIPISEE